ncbi:MAG: AraC family transcriptional regulator [Clostridia bacterium]|nr:AraC family transcriptional regulator [Clostridia bacterium]
MENLLIPVKDIKIYPSNSRIVHCAPGWHGNTVSHCHKFFYVLDGSIVLNIEEQNYIVRKHQLALLPAGLRHSFWLLPGVNMTMIDMEFRAEINGEDIFSFYNCTKDNHVISFPEKEIMEIHNTMINASSGDFYGYFVWASEITKLCALYIKARVDKENAKEEFSEIIDYMRTHVNEDMPLEVLAKKTHYDPTYFSAKFKKAIGMSPLKYFARMRAKEAAHLICTTDMPLPAIANAVGFSNIYYFKRFFLQQMGVEPERYKNVFVAPSYLRETLG